MSLVTPQEALREAVGRAGSQAALARICGVKQPSVWAWLKQGKTLPAEHVLGVESATGISRHRLRPDLYPPGELSHPPLPSDAEGLSLSKPAPAGPYNRGGKLQPKAVLGEPVR